MVVSKRVLANKQISQFSVIHFNSTIFLFPSSMEIDVSVNTILRERFNLIHKSNSRSSLVFSSVFSILYYECMEVDNNKPDDNKSREPINSFQLFYIDNMSRGKPVSKVADNSSIDGSQHVSNEAPALMFLPQIQSQVNNNNESNSKQ